jgi:hypothetical protein
MKIILVRKWDVEQGPSKPNFLLLPFNLNSSRQVKFSDFAYTPC